MRPLRQSLASAEEAIASTLRLAREADLAFVSMPTPMMYLMDRAPGRTPRWRGVTAAKEIMDAGLKLAVGGDNCRDAWFPYGDHDMLDTLKQAVRIFQVDDPMTGALETAARNPADIIRRPDLGRIGVGLPAKLVIFSARSVNSLFCRDQADRIVLNGRRGRVLDGLPRHEDLAEALGVVERDGMTETRKLAAILVADVVGYSRLAGADEERTLARLRALLGDLIEPAIAVHRGRIVKRTGDGFIAEFRSVVDAARSAIETQTGMLDRNAGVSADKRIELRIGIHLGDVVEEADGDLMGDGVNIAARLESLCTPGAISLSEDAYRQLKGRLDAPLTDLGTKQLKNIAEPIRVYALDVGQSPKSGPAPVAEKPGPPRLSIVVLPFANIGGDPEQEHFVDGVTESLTTDLSRIRGAVVIARNTAFTYKGKPFDVKAVGRELNVRYVREGSVQRGGNRMRVNVQLVDAETGSHLWAERSPHKPLADLFDMQDEIVGRLANALSDQLAAVEARHAEQAPNPDSMDLFFQGLSWVHRGRTPRITWRRRAAFSIALSPRILTMSTRSLARRRPISPMAETPLSSIRRRPSRLRKRS